MQRAWDRTNADGAPSWVGMSDLCTQRFHVVMATDGDVEEREIGEALEALGYRGLLVLDQARMSHEHPCPSNWCITLLRAEGHAIPDGVDCCVCWGAGLT